MPAVHWRNRSPRKAKAQVMAIAGSRVKQVRHELSVDICVATANGNGNNSNAMGYWRRDSDEWDRRFAPVGPGCCTRLRDWRFATARTKRPPPPNSTRPSNGLAFRHFRSLRVGGLAATPPPLEVGRRLLHRSRLRPTRDVTIPQHLNSWTYVKSRHRGLKCCELGRCEISIRHSAIPGAWSLRPLALPRCETLPEAADDAASLLLSAYECR